jgi:hypothetical protein
MRKLLATGLLAVAFTLSGTLAGCGGDDGGQAAPAASTDREAALVKYSQCMRENGVPSYPDPVDGRLQLQARKGSDLDPESATFKAAVEKCESLEPAGLQQQGQDPAQQAQMLKWVACMRENGVPNMPDPQADGRMLMDGNSGVDPDSQAFKDAQTKCRDQLPGGVGGN